MDVTEIVPGLFMGGEALFPLPPSGFDVYVSLREVPDLHIPNIPQELQNNGPLFLWAPLIDLEGVPAPPVEKVRSICGFIDSCRLNGKKVLCHCKEGHNRSGLIVAAYLHWFDAYTPENAILLIRAKRPGALSNTAFVTFLMDLS